MVRFRPRASGVIGSRAGFRFPCPQDVGVRVPARPLVSGTDRPAIRLTAVVRELATFTAKQARAAVFGIFLLTAATILGPCYDLLLGLCVAFQAFLLITKREGGREFLGIFLFHAIGLSLELYKVRTGSWRYAGEGWKLGGVPPVTGFMYAAVAGYAMRAARSLDLRFPGWPSPAAVAATILAVAMAFTWHPGGADLRPVTLLVVAATFFRTRAEFSVLPERRRSMPMLASFALIAFFVWIGENWGTAVDLWRYPDQENGWRPVSPSKWLSWTLLMAVALGLAIPFSVARRSMPQKTSPKTAEPVV